MSGLNVGLEDGPGWWVWVRSAAELFAIGAKAGNLKVP